MEKGGQNECGRKREREEGGLEEENGIKRIQIEEWETGTQTHRKTQIVEDTRLT